MNLPFRKSYYHLNTIYISRKNLVHNHQALQQLQPQAKICPVLKSNAYGHGLTTVAPMFDKLDCPYLIVDSLYEAYELYKLKVKTPILILGYTSPKNYSVKKLPFHFTVFDLKTAQMLNKYQPGCSVHIFVDTGMHREGVSLEKLPQFVKEVKKLDNINITGLCSHLADADNPRSQKHTNFQVEQFHTALEILQTNDINPQWKHISASAGVFKIEDPIFTMIRAGLASYGIHPLGLQDEKFSTTTFRPILEFCTTIAQIKKIKKGGKVGYNCTFTAKKDMTVAVLPAGYNDGIDRQLSNKGLVKIGKHFCPILGRVSMNITSVDITSLSNAKVGDKVIIFSQNNDDKNSITNSAKMAHTIPYELLVHFPESTKRKVTP